MKYFLFLLNSILLIVNAFLEGINYSKDNTFFLLVNIGAVLLGLVGIYFTCKVWYAEGNETIKGTKTNISKC